MSTQEDEHREIVRDFLRELVTWANDTGQIEEAAALRHTLMNFDWRMAAEHIDHYDEWLDAGDEADNITVGFLTQIIDHYLEAPR